MFPFRRFEGVDTILGPEMRSTGEVMGRDRSFGLAFLKAALGAGIRLPERGNAFLSVHDGDKDALLPLARELDSLGFRLLATAGTAKALARGGLTAKTVLKVNEGRPNIVDLMINGERGPHREHAARQGVVLRRGRDPPRRRWTATCRA